MPGRESPIGVEFEDERTATLLELLNQISEELKESSSSSTLPIEDAKKKFLLQPPRPPLAKDVRVMIKEYGVNSPASINPSKPLTTRTQTLPEIQTTKRAPTRSASSNKNNELTLSASQLNKMNLSKKPAPNVPPSLPVTSTFKPQQSTHAPFAVELGKAGRKPGYAKHPHSKLYGNMPAHFDLNVVDLEDDNEMMDDISQFSLDASNSPKHEFKGNK